MLQTSREVGGGVFVTSQSFDRCRFFRMNAIKGNQWLVNKKYSIQFTENFPAFIMFFAIAFADIAKLAMFSSIWIACLLLKNKTLNSITAGLVLEKNLIT